jgi:hypothetical protein
MIRFAKRQSPRYRLSLLLKGVIIIFHTLKQIRMGHQVVWMMRRCAHRAFPYAFARYDKISGISKIALARQMIQSLHGGNHRVYVLLDSWYTSKSLIETCLTKGWYVIAALKPTASCIHKEFVHPPKNLPFTSMFPIPTS